MKKEDLSTVLPILAGLLGTIVSDLIADRKFKVIFVVSIMAGITAFFFYDGKDEKKKKYVSGVCGISAVVILCVSTWGSGVTAENFIAHMADFISAGENTYDRETDFYEEAAAINEGLKNTKEERNQADLYKQELEAANAGILKLSEDIRINQFWERQEDQKEIAAVLLMIDESADETYDNGGLRFPGLKESEEMVELFYKMRLSKETCDHYYHNIIKAMEGYGIDCERFGIDEYTLFCWDVEKMFSLYNMRKSMVVELEPDTLYERIELKYDNYKIDMLGYEDDFDYMNWVRDFEDKTGSEMLEKQDKLIVNYYKKFCRNFETEQNVS